MCEGGSYPIFSEQKEAQVFNMIRQNKVIEQQFKTASVKYSVNFSQAIKRLSAFKQLTVSPQCNSAGMKQIPLSTAQKKIKEQHFQ